MRFQNRTDGELREQILTGIRWYRVYSGISLAFRLRPQGRWNSCAFRRGNEYIACDDAKRHAVAEPVALGIRAYGDHGLKAFQQSQKFNGSGTRGIPRGALISADFDNLLLAGRSISVEPACATAVRYCAQCFATGEAAGIMAGLGLDRSLSPAECEYAELPNGCSMTERL